VAASVVGNSMFIIDHGSPTEALLSSWATLAANPFQIPSQFHSLALLVLPGQGQRSPAVAAARKPVVVRGLKRTSIMFLPRTPAMKKCGGETLMMLLRCADSDNVARRKTVHLAILALKNT
jgi:hypothetical protein